MIRKAMRIIPGFALLLLAVILLMMQSKLLEDISSGRVEITCSQGQEILTEAFVSVRANPSLAELEVSWERERLVLAGADLFTSQRLETALMRAGLAANTLTIQDYAWADEVLIQSGELWRLAGVLALIWLFVRSILALGQYEYHRGLHALKKCYLSEYIWQNSVRLLAETVAIVAGGLVCIALLQWLWQVKLTLPTGFLPEGSIFDQEHYKIWWTKTFPADFVSPFGRQLAKTLKQTYLFAAVEVIALLVAAGLVPITKIISEGI